VRFTGVAASNPFVIILAAVHYSVRIRWAARSLAFTPANTALYLFGGLCLSSLGLPLLRCSTYKEVYFRWHHGATVVLKR
jgi:hypothetical protein